MRGTSNPLSILSRKELTWTSTRLLTLWKWMSDMCSMIMKKAWTSRAQRAPSVNFANAVKTNPTVGAIHLTNMVPAQGGLPIMVGDDVIGAIGVSGAPGGDKDEVCAKAGIDKVAADLK